MIINIHGFGGKGENTKYLWLRKAYPDEDIHCRTFDYSATAPGEILSHYAGQAREVLGRLLRLLPERPVPGLPDGAGQPIPEPAPCQEVP